jgi:hypothetical protein
MLRFCGGLTGELGAVGTLSWARAAGAAERAESSPEVLSGHTVEHEVNTEVCNEEHVRHMLENRQVFFLTFRFWILQMKKKHLSVANAFCYARNQNYIHEEVKSELNAGKAY